MRVLLTGLRGVGKSTIRAAVARALGFYHRSVGDFMEEFCLKNFPGITREEMQRKLTVDQQIRISYELVREIRVHPHLILEAQTVISDDFGILIPIQPIFRKAGFGCLILLEADPIVVHKRRLSDPYKIRARRYLNETTVEIAKQQDVARMHITALSVYLGINAFIIDNVGDEKIATTATLRAIETAHQENEFRKRLGDTT